MEKKLHFESESWVESSLKLDCEEILLDMNSTKSDNNPIKIRRIKLRKCCSPVKRKMCIVIDLLDKFKRGSISIRRIIWVPQRWKSSLKF